jgi:hypothetical protein
MSTHTTTPASAVTSPKIKAGVAAGVGLLILQAVIAAVTPEHFAWAGDYSSLFYAAVTGLGVAVAAYLKTDPLRNLGGAVADMGGTTVPEPAPVVEEPEPLPETVEGSADPASPAADHLLSQVDELTATRNRTGSTVGGVQ